ncbi:hypothetical protein Nepgr_033196 [Nepenthes gracilis]|uniref:O-methyltransferase C-terminal domain-containing protein n=1 Tax=Nepenthes gracilis TaxID=150966 RepID=A0AAD3TK25_NEPGR|nr:hypothetical protein Nepgr_033196 [Nepenthes gracilis]
MFLLQCTLYNWFDEQWRTILKNCYEALPKKGKLIVIDFMLSAELDGSYADKVMSGYDNVMMMHQGGQERTVKDLETLCRSSSFSEFVVDSMGEDLVIKGCVDGAMVGDIEPMVAFKEVKTPAGELLGCYGIVGAMN